MAGESSQKTAGLRVLVIGGSIAGLSCAHSLLRAGCQVLVFEKSRSLTAAGAGLGLDADTVSVLRRWGLSEDLLQHTLPLLAEENRVVDIVCKRARIVSKDDNYDHRAAHWSDLHRILHDALPASTVYWGHRVNSFEESNAGRRVRVEVNVVESPDFKEFEGDLLVAADGSMSETRERFVPHEERRYCGYCAWRGVLDTSSEEGSKIKARLHEQYPNLGRNLYFDIAVRTHAVLYELWGGRLNWLWYCNQAEPNLKGSSVTAMVDEAAIATMRKEAREMWTSELADLMCATPAPFVNAIFDREPLQQLVWGRVALVGEAAHPTSPHGLRSTNMSILDAAVLGECISKCGSQVDRALEEYQSIRLPVTSQQVLFSRHLGQAKQGFSQDITNLSDGDWEKLLQRNMHKPQEK